MAHATPSVRNGVVTLGAPGSQQFRAVGGAWLNWLEQPDTTAFRFDDAGTRFTARRERQRGHRYWYAYRRRGGKLHKAYLGRSSDLTLERLTEVARRLDEPAARAMDGHVHAASARVANDQANHNLPGQVSSFLGRDAELFELRRMLHTSRLITLTGAGGVGKTRLALELATGAVGTVADAVWLVELASLADAALVPQVVAQAAGIYQQPNRPLLASLGAALNAGRVLLVLDNCEHLLDACAQFAHDLLSHCTMLKVLATSREPLGVTGEIAWRVPSLQLPPQPEHLSLDDLAQSDAVRLFVDRARSTRHDFVLTAENSAAVVEVCRRLDGIPLAIELAAARVRVLAPEEITARLDDRFRLLAAGSRTAPARHQTLRTAIDWSYDLLTEPERRVFERLAVFAGDFSLDAAEAVCATHEIDAAAVLDLITRLVDRSLVVAEPAEAEPTRCRLLETLRLYALERLVESGEEDDARAHHAAWMETRAEDLLRAVRGPDQGRWLRWAEREQDNARAVLTWAIEQQQALLAARVTAGFTWSWLIHLRWSEGLEWVHKVLALPNAAPPRERAMLLIWAIQLALFRGDVASNRPSGVRGTLHGWLEECLALADSLGDDGLRLAANGMIHAIREFGVELEGLPHMSIEELQRESRRIGDTFGECRGLEVLARRALHAGDLDTAASHLKEAAGMAKAAGDTLSLALVLNQLGDVERARGAHTRARALYEESIALFADLGLVAQPSLVHNLGYVALAAGNWAEAAARFAEGLTLFRRLGEERGLAECIIGFGCLAAAQGRGADAATLFGAAEAALEALSTQVWPANRPDYEHWQARARGSLGAAAFTRALAAGRSLSLEQASALALEQRTRRDRVRSSSDGKIEVLTPREREVAQLVARGLTNRQIAGTLVISEKTAANHLQHVLEKLDFRTRTQLAARAAELGLVSEDGTHTTRV